MTVTYDLATAQADYPACEGPPQRTLLICSHPRSGSTLLGEYLHATDLFGCPLEYFHRGFRPAFAERWQAPTMQSLIEAAWRHRTAPGGLFSAKLFWQDMEDIVEELEPSILVGLREETGTQASPEVYRHLYRLLTSLFPQPSFIYLSRQDRVRQAVSALVATCTRQWRDVPGQGRQQPAEEAVYDYERILGLIAFADQSHNHWQRFFTANEITPFRLSYEELIAKECHALLALFARLGYTGALPVQRLQRQANQETEKLLARFLRDYQARQVNAV